MKYLTPLLLLTLVGCASDSSLPKTVAVPIETTPVGTVTDPNGNTDVRTDEVVKTYPVGPYVDAAGVRHDGHDVERLEQSANWNLAPNTPTAINMGAQVAVADPNQEKQALNGELQEQMVKEQMLLKITASQNDAMAQQIATLKARQQASDADKQSAADLKAQIQELQKQIDELKSKQTSTAPAKQKTPETAQTQPQTQSSWLSGWFQSKPAAPSDSTPDSAPVASSAPVTPAPAAPAPQPPTPDTSDMTGADNSSIPVQTLPPVPQTPVTTASNNQPNQ